MPSSHCTIFHLLTGFDKSPTNARHRREIGARSRERQSRSVRSEVIADASPTPGKYLHAKYLELSAIHNPAV